MPKKFWVLIVGAVIVVVILPLVIDRLIIGNSFPSNISNSDWVGFLGGYIGSIMGCIISLVGILWTINFTRAQNRADRELQIKPFLDIRYRDTQKIDDGFNQLGYMMINIKEVDDDKMLMIGSGDLLIKNIGNGAAVNFTVSYFVYSDAEKYWLKYVNSRETVTTNTVKPDETAKITFEIQSSRRGPTAEELRDGEEEGSFVFDESYRLPTPFSVRIVLTYCDLLSNQYRQVLLFNAQFPLNERLRIGTRIPCFLTLQHTAPPQMVHSTRSKGDNSLYQ